MDILEAVGNTTMTSNLTCPRGMWPLDGEAAVCGYGTCVSGVCVCEEGWTQNGDFDFRPPGVDCDKYAPTLETMWWFGGIAMIFVLPIAIKAVMACQQLLHEGKKGIEFTRDTYIWGLLGCTFYIIWCFYRATHIGETLGHDVVVSLLYGLWLSLWLQCAKNLAILLLDLVWIPGEAIERLKKTLKYCMPVSQALLSLCPLICIAVDGNEWAAYFFAMLHWRVYKKNTPRLQLAAAFLSSLSSPHRLVSQLRAPCNISRRHR